MPTKKSQRVEPIREVEGNFLPTEIVDRVEHLFIVRDFDGPMVERRLSIRRPLLEKALKAVINRNRKPPGSASVLNLVRRSA